ncbi:MAG TPA: cytochrome b N-terminal domain-containing protein [Aggregatilinea sp.]|uniref:cytochrome b N-terminal domain-containing protein n=1 Tax=Aggregatilinea sp. TaxID=2806333 RepID=UPI002B9E2DD6|nr:cytochrome b N-terminal domain-containing protein [Aggregatilinea sp.]HML21955.1 cytochrome b N-terminal domain-containing protein [Aggregatilinea sp.]
MRPNFFHHLHPPTIPAQQSRWRYTLGAGGTAIFLVLVLGITGALEMFYYVPTPDEAALSVQTLTYHVALGGLVRGVHYWAAQLLLVVATVHLVRVVMTGAYAPPRRFNHLLGLILFVALILLDFTGYVLRWDQGVQWALVVGTNLIKSIPGVGETLYRVTVGGTRPGPATLTRFYAWHILGLGLVAIFFTGWHIFKVRRNGGIAVPPPTLRPDPARITRYELVRREVLAMLVAGAILIVLAAFVPAPIAAPITDISAPSPDARAPWFFLWVQHMLGWGDPFVWGVAVPLIVLIVLAAIPYVLPRPADAELGQWFPRSGRIAQGVLGIVALGVVVLTVLGWLGGM